MEVVLGMGTVRGSGNLMKKMPAGHKARKIMVRLRTQRAREPSVKSFLLLPHLYLPELPNDGIYNSAVFVSVCVHVCLLL